MITEIHQVANLRLKAEVERIATERQRVVEANVGLSHKCAKLAEALEQISAYAGDKSQLSYEGWLYGIESLADAALDEYRKDQ